MLMWVRALHPLRGTPDIFNAALLDFSSLEFVFQSSPESPQLPGAHYSLSNEGELTRSTLGEFLNLIFLLLLCRWQ